MIDLSSKGMCLPHLFKTLDLKRMGFESSDRKPIS